MDANTEMERVLASRLGHILVSTDTSSFECFRRQLLVLVRHEMAAEGEIVDRGTLAAQIIDTNLITTLSISEIHFSRFSSPTLGSGTPRL